MITYKNLENNLWQINEILREGAEVELRLVDQWILVETNSGADIFILQVDSNYEIITSASEKFSFLEPTLTHSKEDYKNLQKKWLRKTEEKEKSKKLVLANLPFLSLNSQGNLINNDLTADNPHQVQIKEKIINLNQFLSADKWEIKQAILVEIIENHDAWKIIGGDIVNSENPERKFPITGWEKTTEAIKDQELLWLWLKTKTQLIESIKKTEMVRFWGKIFSCGGIGVMIIVVIWLLGRKYRKNKNK